MQKFRLQKLLPNNDLSPQPPMEKPISPQLSGKLLGSGTYGKVYLSNCGKYAVKTLPVEENGGDLTASSLREVACNQALKLNGCIWAAEINAMSYEIVRKSSYVFLAMRKYTMDLSSWISMHKKQKRAISLFNIRLIMRSVLSAVLFASNLLILHRDIKPQNILLQLGSRDDDIRHVALADWGLARFLECHDVALLTNVVQTLCYRAPEILINHNIHSVKMEIWSIGIVLAELYNQKPLMLQKTEGSLLQLYKIFQKLGTPSETDWPAFIKGKKTDTLPQFKGKPWAMLVPTADELCHNLLQRMLCFDPDKRATCEEALQHAFFKPVLVKINSSSSSSSSFLDESALSPGTVARVLSNCEDPVTPGRRRKRARAMMQLNEEYEEKTQEAVEEEEEEEAEEEIMVDDASYESELLMQKLQRIYQMEKKAADVLKPVDVEILKHYFPREKENDFRLQTLVWMLDIINAEQYHIHTYFLAIELLDLALSQSNFDKRENVFFIGSICVGVAAKLGERTIHTQGSHWNTCCTYQKKLKLALVNNKNATAHNVPMLGPLLGLKYVAKENSLCFDLFHGNLFRVTSYTYLQQILHFHNNTDATQNTLMFSILLVAKLHYEVLEGFESLELALEIYQFVVEGKHSDLIQKVLENCAVFEFIKEVLGSIYNRNFQSIDDDEEEEDDDDVKQKLN